MRQLVVAGPEAIEGVLRLLSDDEIWTYLMVDSKRCQNTNPSWMLYYEDSASKWFRQWCILHEANLMAER